MKDRDFNLWIGRFSNKKAAKSENIDTIEPLIISHWQPDLNEKKKAYYPVQQLDDVIFYDINTNIVWGAERLKKRNRLFKSISNGFVIKNG